MNIRSTFIKPYSSPKEGEEIKSIVAFRKHWIATEYEFDAVVSRVYQYSLRINLWFAILDFQWEKLIKESNNPNAHESKK